MKYNNKSITGLVLASIIALSSAAQSVPPLINYQGQLTDRTGAPLAVGSYSVQFKLWNDPFQATTANLIWGQQQSVSILSNGVFNVILGSPGGMAIPGTTPAVNNLAYAFAGSNCYLGLTVVANPSGTVANPTEIVPRQQLLSVPFAFQAEQAQVAATVSPGSIVNASLTSGLVELTNLAPRHVGTNVGVGGVAVSLPSGIQSYNGAAFQDIANMSVMIQTTGRPVMAFLSPPVTNTVSTPNVAPLGFMQFITPANYFVLQLIRDAGQADQAVITSGIGTGSGGQGSVGYPTPFMVMDFNPPPGQHTYQLQWGSPTGTGSGYLSIDNMVLVVFEQ